MSVKPMHDETRPAPQLIELTEMTEREVQGAPLFAGNLNLIKGLKVRLAVSAGDASITVGELFSLKESSILKLDRLTDDPVDILLEGQVIARGRLVAVDDNFGVSITELPQPPKA